MNNFKGGHNKGRSKFNGKKSFGRDERRGGGGGGYTRENRSGNNSTEMFSTTCSECHKACTVPFRPSSAKPVYCSACFGMRKDNDEGSRYPFSERARADRGSYNEHTNTKLPRDQRSPRHIPRYTPRHDVTNGQTSNDIEGLKRQITGLEAKLDRILDIINQPKPSETAPSTKEKTATTTPKKVAKKAAPKDAEKAIKKVTKKVAKKTSKKTTKK